MDGMPSVLSCRIVAILGFALIGGLVVHDVTQKQHAVLRDFPVVGRRQARCSAQ